MKKNENQSKTKDGPKRKKKNCIDDGRIRTWTELRGEQVNVCFARSKQTHLILGVPKGFLVSGFSKMGQCYASRHKEK